MRKTVIWVRPRVKNRHFEFCFNLACSNWQINVIFTVADPDLELRGAWFFCCLPCRLFFLLRFYFFFLLNAYRYFTQGRNEVLLTQRREPRLRLEPKHMILFCCVYKDRLVLRFTSVFFGSLQFSSVHSWNTCIAKGPQKHIFFNIK